MKPGERDCGCPSVSGFLRKCKLLGGEATDACPDFVDWDADEWNTDQWIKELREDGD